MSTFDDDTDPSSVTQESIATLLGGEIIAVPDGATVREAAKALNDAEVGLVVVGTAQEVACVVSERDIVRAVAEGSDLDTTSAGDAGSSDLRWATIDSTVSEVVDEMMTSYVRHILVRGEDGSLAGVVSVRDVLAASQR